MTTTARDFRGSSRQRLVIGVGRQQERRVLQACLDDRSLRVVGRCNSAVDLVHRVAQEQADLLLLDDDLHLLDTDRLEDLTRRRRLRVVLLAHDPDAARWQTLQAVVLPWTADLPEIRSGLDRALGRDFGRPRSSSTDAIVPASTVVSTETSPRDFDDRRSQVVALFGGPGSPGRTTLAVNLLAILGASRCVVLVDLDTTAAAVAAHLRAVQPAWNILDVALKAPQSAEAWDEALDPRLQRIGSYSQRARVLCGVPRPRERASLSGSFIEGLIAHLRERFDHILLDLGDEPMSDSNTETLVTSSALRASDHVLLVAAPDPVRLHHAQMARDEASSLLDPTRTSVVLNRCGRGEDGRASSAALELPIIALIPFDTSVARALADGEPAVCDPGSRMRRPLGDLAEAIAGQKVNIPASVRPEVQTGRLAWLRPLLTPAAGLLGGPR